METDDGRGARRDDAAAGTRRVLIHTVEGDFHAAVTGHALRLRGHEVVRWRGDHYPEFSASTVRFGRDGMQGTLVCDGRTVSSDAVDVVWYRRRRLVSSPDYVDPRDQAFCTEELRMAERSHPEAFADAFWINPPAASLLCEVKAHQFRHALAAGLAVPRTLISNDPATIRNFILEVEDCIYKPLGGYIWKEDGASLKTYTAKVAMDDLPSDALLRATPGIFQEKVAKAYEVRAQFFGHSCFAIRIDSNTLEGGDLDWRLDQRSIRRCEPAPLPAKVEAACIALMARLGIVSGGFDFIVTPEGNWQFLEVNEAGQFFFIESWCPDLPVLDAFCQFIEAARADFRYSAPGTPITLTQATVSAYEHGLISK
ncbi:hypothetical protein MNO14_05795 [Luteimonas sp. S4-F44]|uniref:MvdC/MvdD family ATP grasp protein n=1 Tax=Luteimonas sp. S4-F44 TaxID=2925842 RepID=UPI001F536C8D|nr:hypothetical protein [Luteimonas sp. S4-F44]UNK43582.1 hypothetical protein MNO14_05795 [Luteimonas sp. S4-F44]